MKYSQEQRAEHVAMVKRVIVQMEAQNVYPSIVRIRESLEKSTGKLYHQDYINRIKNKIILERANRIDRKVLSTELAKVEDRFAELTERLYRVLRDERSKPMEKIMASRAIAMLEKTLMDMKMDTGVFRRQIGVLGVLVEDSVATRIVKALGITDDRRTIQRSSTTAGQLPAPSPQNNAVQLPN